MFITYVFCSLVKFISSQTKDNCKNTHRISTKPLGFWKETYQTELNHLTTWRRKIGPSSLPLFLTLIDQIWQKLYQKPEKWILVSWQQWLWIQDSKKKTRITVLIQLIKMEDNQSEEWNRTSRLFFYTPLLKKSMNVHRRTITAKLFGIFFGSRNFINKYSLPLLTLKTDSKVSSNSNKPFWRTSITKPLSD